MTQPFSFENPEQPPVFLTNSLERLGGNFDELSTEEYERLTLDELNLAFMDLDELETPHPSIPFFITKSAHTQMDLHRAGFLDSPSDRPVLDFRASPQITEHIIDGITYDTFVVEARVRTPAPKKQIWTRNNEEADTTKKDTYPDQHTLKRMWLFGAMGRTEAEIFNPELITLDHISHAVVRSAARRHTAFSVVTREHSGVTEKMGDIDEHDGSITERQVGISPDLTGKPFTLLEPLPFDETRKSIIDHAIALQYIAQGYKESNNDASEKSIAPSARKAKQVIGGTAALIGTSILHKVTRATHRPHNT